MERFMSTFTSKALWDFLLRGSPSSPSRTICFTNYQTKEYPEMIKLEPMGSPFNSDRSWDEKGKNMISNIYVIFDDYGIQSLQFIYFHEGAHVESQKHGHSGGQHIKRVTLENDEYVTALSGVYYEHRIRSLTFHTNKRKHGPFCKKFAHAYWKREIDVGIRDRSEFGGLFGSFTIGYSCGGYLSSIGMYVSHNAVPRTRFGATYEHQLIPLESLIGSYNHETSLPNPEDSRWFSCEA
ncbi:hypothetical protein Bca101_080397 [Brassica carinata]